MAAKLDHCKRGHDFSIHTAIHRLQPVDREERERRVHHLGVPMQPVLPTGMSDIICWPLFDVRADVSIIGAC